MRGVVALALLLGGCAPMKPVYGEPEPLALVQPGTDLKRWYVVVDHGEAGEQLWFLDTGYAVTTCDDDFAETLGLELRGRGRVQGFTGTVPTRRTRVPELPLGEHRVRKMRCSVRDLDSTSSIQDPVQVPIAGVIGADLLRHFHFVIDPEAATLTLDHPRNAPRLSLDDPTVLRLPVATPLYARRMIPVEIGEQTVRLLLDTGASGTHLDGGELGLEPFMVREGAKVFGSGADGESVRDLPMYREDLRLGGHTLREVTLTGTDGSGRRYGVLGVNVLEHYRQTYDWKRGRVRLEAVTPGEIPRYP